MFCPECKAEYLPGVTRCSDCDAVLVDRLSESGCDSDGELSDANLRGVWSGEDQDECVSICAQLRDAEIPFKVAQGKRQFFKDVDEKFAIGVPPKFCSQAKEIIDSAHADFTDDASDEAILELPAQDGIADTSEVDKDPDSHKWNPENASVEVWSQQTPNDDLMIESSLRENYINYRADVLGNGSRKIFVMPKDELRSREIVREIETGTPPK
jgi:hypothetical protein